MTNGNQTSSSILAVGVTGMSLEPSRMIFSAKKYSSAKPSPICLYHISSNKYWVSNDISMMHPYQNKRLLISAALPNKTLISNVKYDYNLTETKIKCIQNETVRETKAVL